MEYTTVVGVTAERPLGEQYAAMLMACCVGEAVRDVGGHSLVVVNDASPMVRGGWAGGLVGGRVCGRAGMCWWW